MFFMADINYMEALEQELSVIACKNKDTSSYSEFKKLVIEFKKKLKLKNKNGNN
jgi:hypothetical protein